MLETNLINDRVTLVLNELQQTFKKLYGSRLIDLVLYGSQARGEAHADSDIDVLVVLAGEVDPWTEIERGGEITADLSLKYDVVISCVYMPANRYANDKDSPLLKNIAHEGVSL